VRRGFGAARAVTGIFGDYPCRVTTIRHYGSAMEAQSAALHLIEHGVLAGVIEDGLGKGELYPGMALGAAGLAGGAPRFRLVLADAEDREAAGLLLEEFDEQPMELAEGWEEQALEAVEPSGEADHAADSDRVRVDLEAGVLRELPLACHECGYPLRHLAVTGRCPECGAEYDKAELVGLLIDPSSR